MAGRLIARIPLDGNALGMTLSHHGSHLFVAEDNADQVAVIDTGSNRVVAKIDARGPANLLSGDRDDHGHDFDRDYDDPPRRSRLTGAATFAVTLSPDGQTLYAVNSGSNSIAVIPLHGKDAYRVAGLIPTAYEPHDITFSANGRTMYIVNGKSVTGPNPGHLASNTAAITAFMYPGGNTLAAALARASNQYQFQLERASLVSAPVPEEWELDRLTRKVAENNFYNNDAERARAAGGALPAQAHQARHLHRQGEPHVRPDPRRSDQRRERRQHAGPVRASPSRPTSTTWRASSSRWTTSTTPATAAWTAGRGRCRAA